MCVLRDYWNNCDLRKKGFSWTTGIISFGFTVLPESVLNFNAFTLGIPLKNLILVNRIMLAAFVYVLISVVIMLWMCYRRKIVISGRNYRIKIEYGDIFKMKKCKKVIAFDECFTMKVGDRPEDIYPNSICGKFLQKYSDFNEDVLQKHIRAVNLSPLTTISEFANKVHYKPGSVVPFNEYLLLAFVTLNKDGIGVISYEQYLDCLNLLWKEIDKYHAGEDVCIPILGSGSATRIGDGTLTKQELLDVIIASYKLSANKLHPCTLHIICLPDKDFSLNRIGEFI